mmetsp:Transcript_6519/g.19329  ORF Transcript_6519/g.19329 Transcript_6519/m.19329 type:complete len:251 (+) Transcript_6519:1422-2174(+)
MLSVHRDGERVRAQHVVCGSVHVVARGGAVTGEAAVEALPVAQRRCMPARVSLDHKSPWLVESVPLLDAISERSEAKVSVVSKGAGQAVVEPAAVLRGMPVLRIIKERLGKIPVVERDHRLDAVLDEAIDESVVKVDSPHLSHAPGSGNSAVGQNAGPGDGEAIGLEAKALQHLDVFLHFVVVVCGNRRCLALAIRHARVDGRSVCPREHVPDGQALAVRVPGALDLEARRPSSEHEAGGEGHAVLKPGG